MPSFYIPLSGLDADSTALNTIANNLSNMNTTGFKAQTTNFSDLFYQQMGSTGSGDEIQAGTGVQVASNSTDFTGGSISSTGIATDAGINGTGFFVLDNNGSQLYTRDGNFQTSAAGALQSTDGQSVMGYSAVNGVVNTSGGLSDIVIPVGQVMQPSATSSFSMTQNLDSESPVGTQTSGQVQLYDSLGNKYDATVTYTNLGSNQWSYRITVPDTLSAAPATAAAAVTLPVATPTPTATTVTVGATAVAPTTIAVGSSVTATTPIAISTNTTLAAAAATPGSISHPAVTSDAPVSTPVANSALAAAAGSPAGTYLYNFNGSGATVGSATNLTITGLDGAGNSQTISAPAIGANESLAAYAADLTTALGPTGANIVGVKVSVNGSQLSIVGPASLTTANGVSQDFSSTTSGFNFATTATIDPAVAMTITGPTTSGGTATIVAPAIGVNETVSQYATALNTALGPAGAKMVGVVVNGKDATGLLSIAGPSTMTINGSASLAQDVALTTTNYNFVTSNGALATVDPLTTLNITEGALGPVTAPAFTSSQSVASYAAALQGALTTAGITDVTVNGANGTLSIKGPSNMAIAGAVKQDFSGTQTNYNFGTYTDPTTGLTTPATIASTTSLTISAPKTDGTVGTITVPPSNPAGESVGQYVIDLQGALGQAKITGVTVQAVNGQLSIVGPTTMTVAGSVNQDMVGTTNLYNFQANATVDPTTNLVITGQTASGATVAITAPAVASGETVSQYATALASALTADKIANVTVTATNGQLSIVGANMSTTGQVKQGLADSAINYDFGSSATVNAATNITIVGPTLSGNPATAITTAPPVIAGETVAQYATALSNALTQAGIDTGPDGVSVSANGGQLSIIGPTATLKTAGSASQDLSAQTISYNFGASGGQVATVDPTTNLAITGLTTSGATATTTAPTITPGQTLIGYASALTSALANAGITGVTVTATAAGQLSITGANISTAGSLIQDPVASANASGTLTFNSSGNLLAPAANLTNISFAGLADDAATMNMTWNLFGASGTGNISQTAAASGQSAQNANGYSSGAYEQFTIASDGTIAATYSNGQTQNVGQVAIASVSNQQGLVDVGSTEYQTTAASGQAAAGVAGTDGRGTLEGASLEASNVNISAEFSDLIIAQRAFEANSKAVTTFDTVTQETINMIH